MKFLIWDEATETRRLSAFSVPDFRSGRANVTNGATEVSVNFSTPIPDRNQYTLICTWQNILDPFPQLQPVSIKSMTETGFVVQWNAPVDSSNYKLNWYCMVFS